MRLARGVAADLFLVHFDDIAVLHVQLLGRFVVVDASSVEEKAERADRHALSVAVGFLQLAHVGGELDLEVNFAVVLADHLQFDVLVTAFNIEYVNI